MKAKTVRLKTICKGILLLILVAGCHKSNTVNTGSQDLFPNKIGDNWHYMVKDTTLQGNLDSGSTQYNVDVLIVDTFKWINGITATIWQFNYPGWTDSNYVFQTGDTIRFMDRTNTYIVRQYIIPFATGSSWPYIPGISNVTVLGQSDITVGSNVFTSAWQIYGYAGMPDASFTIDQWFKDNIGFVRLYLNPSGELILTKHIQDWSLISYELK
jgi:hypothetical protein